MRATHDQLDAAFTALAHETRRRILDLLRDRPGIAVGEVASKFDVSRIAIMKHLHVLEEAGLVHSEKSGRVRRLYFNTAPIRMIYDRWTDDYSDYWSGEVTRLKYLAEMRAQETPPTAARKKRVK